MKSVYLVISLQVLLANANDLENNQSFRVLRGKGRGGGRGRGRGGGWGGRGNGGRGSGGGWNSERREMMETIHNLVQNHEMIQREVTKTDDGVHAYTWSTDDDVSDWIKNHVEQMKALMEADEGGIRLWDDLFELAWQYHDFNTLTITETTEHGVNVTHSVNDDVSDDDRECIVAVIHDHADVVSSFITNGMEEVQSNHPVPSVCNN